jgi:hypothetical protein
MALFFKINTYLFKKIYEKRDFYYNIIVEVVSKNTFDYLKSKRNASSTLST